MKTLNVTNPNYLKEFVDPRQNDIRIVVDSLTVSWSNDDNLVLQNISFTVDKVSNYCPSISFANYIH